MPSSVIKSFYRGLFLRNKLKSILHFSENISKIHTANYTIELIPKFIFSDLSSVSDLIHIDNVSFYLKKAEILHLYLSLRTLLLTVLLVAASRDSLIYQSLYLIGDLYF